MTGVPVLVHSLSVLATLVVVTVFRRIHVFFIQFHDGHFAPIGALPPLVRRRASFFRFLDLSLGGCELVFYVSHFAVFEL